MSIDLQALYAELNAKYFDGALPSIDDDDRVTIEPGIPGEDIYKNAAEMDCYGLTDSREAFGLGGNVVTRYYTIYLHSILFDPTVRGISATVRTVLLHEMAHVATIERYGKLRAGNHGKRFSAECNRIGQSQGWSDVCSTEGLRQGWWDYPHPSGQRFNERDGCQFWPNFSMGEEAAAEFEMTP